MSIFTKLMSVIRGNAEAQIPGGALAKKGAGNVIPTVKFDPKRVTEAVRVDLRKNIKKVREFDESNFEKIYEASLQSVSRGRDLGLLATAIMDLKLPGMTKQRAGEIALSLNNKATALMNRDRKKSNI